MFGNGYDGVKQQKKSDLAKDSAITILTSGCHFKGKLFCRGSTRIGGRIEGEIVSEGLLIIEEEAHVNTDIVAEEIIIQGKVEGKIEAKGRVELCSSSRFEGDITSPILVIKEGAMFNGTSRMNLQTDTEVVKVKFDKKDVVHPLEEKEKDSGFQSKTPKPSEVKIAT
ncbi:MAG: polymer-forming cytoskeletal protein [Oligoflexales bacterium]|nr:polymer-forming cytoskeletal protein [Oligoflexales bacterium]